MKGLIAGLYLTYRLFTFDTNNDNIDDYAVAKFNDGQVMLFFDNDFDKKYDRLITNGESTSIDIPIFGFVNSEGKHFSFETKKKSYHIANYPYFSRQFVINKKVLERHLKHPKSKFFDETFRQSPATMRDKINYRWIGKPVHAPVVQYLQ